MFDVKRLFAGLKRASLASAHARGIVALETGRFAAAHDEFSAAIAAAAGPAERARAYNKRGVALIGLGRRNEALDDFCSALAADERCAPALVNIGNMLFEDGHVYDAIDYYEAAIVADDAYHVAYGNLGAAYKRIGRRSEAVRNLRLAARIAARRRPERA